LQGRTFTAASKHGVKDHVPTQPAEQGVTTTGGDSIVTGSKHCTCYRVHVPLGPANNVLTTREHFPLQPANKVFTTREHFPLQPEKKVSTTCKTPLSSRSEYTRPVGQRRLYQGMKAKGISFGTLGRLAIPLVQWNHGTPLQTHIPRFDMMWDVQDPGSAFRSRRRVALSSSKNYVSVLPCRTLMKVAVSSPIRLRGRRRGLHYGQ
jgi:hypothetical protein